MYIRVPLSALVLRKMEGEAGINQRHARQGVRVRGGREGGRDGGREGERGRGRGRGRGRNRNMNVPNEIRATIVDHVLNHGLSMAEAGRRLSQKLT